MHDPKLHGHVDSLTLTEIIEKRRFHIKDPYLQQTLEENYDFMIQKVDPIISEALEQVLLYQPEQAAEFLADFMKGTLEPKNFNYTVRKENLLVMLFLILKTLYWI